MFLYDDKTQGAETKVSEQVYQITRDTYTSCQEFSDPNLFQQVFQEDICPTPAPHSDPFQRTYVDRLPDSRRSSRGND